MRYLLAVFSLAAALSGQTRVTETRLGRASVQDDGTNLVIKGRTLKSSLYQAGPRTIGAGANQLPAAASCAGCWTDVSDAGGPTDCTVGGGTTVVMCFSDGATWAVIGTGGGSGSLVITTGAINPAAACVAPSSSNLAKYYNTAAKTMWTCVDTNTWKQDQESDPTATFSITGNAGTDPCGTVAGGQDCLFFNSANSNHFTRKIGSTLHDVEAGGVSVTQGSYASLPGTCTTNDLYFFTSGLFGNARCSATNTWSFFYDGHIITPAASLSLATLGTATAPSALNSAKGYELLTQNGGGSTSTSARYWTPCSQPCITKVVIRQAAIPYGNANRRKFTVGYMDSAGLMSGITCTYPDADIFTMYCQDVHIDATGAQISCCVSSSHVPAGNVAHGRDMVVMLQDDGTNINFGFSNSDDDVFEILRTELRGSYLSSPSRAFYGATNYATGVFTMTLVGTLN